MSGNWVKRTRENLFRYLSKINAARVTSVY